MKRQIKLKVWDEVQNKFLPTDAENVYWNCADGILTAHIDESGDWRELLIIESIGGQDKNGNEVYHGDTVKVRGMKRTDEYITNVVWRKHGFTLEENKTYLNDDACLLSSNIEIIGNRYEHPNLIKNEK